MTKEQKIELQHKTLLIIASVSVKSFLMAIASSQVFCESIEPSGLFFNCIDNVAYVGASIAAVAIMGAVFGYYVIRIKTFDSIFARMLKADFIITAMYFGAAFSAPELISMKVMIWLFGIWILGMLLAPFDKDMILVKKITQYGSIAALGALLTVHFIPTFEQFGDSYTIGMMVSSILGIFGSGRNG